MLSTEKEKGHLAPILRSGNQGSQPSVISYSFLTLTGVMLEHDWSYNGAC